MTDLDLRLVRYFVATAEELHFGRAAERLFITQQTLSSQIARLEADLGVVLFDRSSRHVQLTRVGKEFLAESRQLLDQASRSIAAARGARAVVRIASINDRIDTVPLVMEACRERAPEVQLECILAPLSEQIRLVQSGELDVALGRAYRLPSGLTSEVFRLDRAHTITQLDPSSTNSGPLAWRTLDGVAIQVPPIRYAPQLASFLEALRGDHGLSFTIAPTGSTSLEVSLQQLQRGRTVQLGFDSFRILEDGVLDSVMIEPTALYAWSAIRRTGAVDDGLARVLDAVHALSEERGWMEPPATAADYWLPAEDMSASLRSRLDRLMSSPEPPNIHLPGGRSIHSA